MSSILITEQKYKYVWHICSITSFLFVYYVHRQTYFVYFWLMAGKIDINTSRNWHAINKLPRGSLFFFFKACFFGFNNRMTLVSRSSLQITKQTCRVMVAHISFGCGCRFIVSYCRKQRQGFGTTYGNYLFKELIKWNCTLATSTPHSLGHFSKFLFYPPHGFRTCKLLMLYTPNNILRKQNSSHQQK